MIRPDRESFSEINLLCAEHEVPVQITPFFKHFPDILKNH